MLFHDQKHAAIVFGFAFVSCFGGEFLELDWGSAEEVILHHKFRYFQEVGGSAVTCDWL